ncbi:hypothetical protein EIN_002280 [Entamoeba invadens IP1]|uniref:CCHC-type domain-containing protein n=1 Tax=Entamoeba invadens IP1 TaxID=370355 RepID=L7FJN4_ENTIV|nr:hypothetical protein EIN_002280 [Entamoeba invadens IP1]ELP83567.1 hypothetical protein EIN_002280 [Entamoeba invadens IP1]|eukprot:XP_004182913.1 hypothetical protein EIN_002280 [Entamoeba invadens IP1]
MTETNPITVRIQPIDSTMTDDDIHALFDKYSPVSYDNPRYEKDTPLNYCIITMGDKEAADTLIKEKNGSEWDGVKIKMYVDKKDPSRLTVNFLYGTLNKDEKDVKKYLKGYKVKSVERLISKKGTLMRSYLHVVLKDLESAIQMKKDFETREETKKYELQFITKTGEHINQCFICGKYGHKKADCPEKGKHAPVIKTRDMKIAEQKHKKYVLKKKEQNKNKKGIKREKQNTKE